MKSVLVDFRRPRRPPRWAWFAVAVLGLAAAASLVVASMQQRKLNELRAQRDELIRAKANPPPRLISTPRPAPYEASAREMLAEATSKWPAMLTAIESMSIIGVTPVAIEIVPAEREIRVEVEFVDYATLLKFLDELNAGQPMPRWVLVQAQSAAAAIGQKSTATVRGTWPP